VCPAARAGRCLILVPKCVARQRRTLHPPSGGAAAPPLSKAGTPIADLVPHQAASVTFGALKGQVTYSDQAFDLDPDIQQMFYGPEPGPLRKSGGSGDLSGPGGDAA